MADDTLTNFRKVNRYVAVRNRQYSVSEPFAKERGFSLSELLALVALHFDEFGNPSEGCTQREMVARENLTKQTASAIVKSFHQRGWVRLDEDPNDRRCKIIRLTDEGRAATTPIVEEFVERWNAAVGGLSDEEYRQLMIGMGRLADLVDESFSGAL